MASRTRTRSGLERLPSGSLKTSESAEKDQQTHERLRQIGEQCDLTQESFDYLLKLLIDRSSLQISILRSCDIHGKLFNLANSNFVAPLFHPITQNWSVIYVQTIVDSGRYTINVKHYCPNPTQQRRSQVSDKLRSDARRQYGKDAKVNYTHEEGPTASHKNATGIYALMGALDFGTHHCFQSKDKFWGGGPVTTIKGAYKQLGFGNGAEGMRSAARTPKSNAQKGWDLPSYEEQGIFGAKMPASATKRRRTELVEPVAFDVKKKLHDAALFISKLGLPSVTDLQQEFDERRKERSEHNEVTRGMQKTCTELDTKINDDERRVSKWLSEFPQNLNFAIDTERYKTRGESKWKPGRDSLMEAQNRKRKAN
ncbi:hypothetical protein FCIRC_215 [Fusarium circinatum]|uniref:Uncharacterized protein n=1 Tax=Fusarium circinatum TaxID=48490 RepID=A0A8H5XEF3_FUSCI|nr:hypothetical protein FCIRC_215 [Fusarium circinatum]